MKSPIAYAILVLSLIAFSAQATIHYVPGQYNSIQAGIDAAQDGDTVLVAAGTYDGWRDRNLDFGGRAILVTSVCGPDSCIIDCENGGRGFYFHTSENTTSIVSGFTIYDAYEADGGGIYCQNASPLIRDCILLECAAVDDGGGIYLEGSSAIIEDCEILNCDADDGAGISCDDGCYPTFESCVISGNIAEDICGGILFRSGTQTVNNCLISGNTSGGPGGGIYCFESFLTITNSTVSNNNATYNGGGIVCFSYSLNVENCIIDANHCNWSGGGVSFQSDGNLVFNNCTISNNYAGSRGGGILSDGGSVSQMVVTRCTINDNTANYGGGVCLDWVFNNTFENCTFSGNLAYSHGGGIQLEDCDATFRNTIFAGNIAGYGIYFDGGDAEVQHCDFYGNGNGNIGGNSIPSYLGTLVFVNANHDSCDMFWNIFLDPLFVGGGDFHLTENSPCIDAGAWITPLDPDSTIADIGRFYFDQSWTDIQVDLTYVSGSPVPVGGGDLVFDVFVENCAAVPGNFDAWLETAYEGGIPTTLVLRSFANFLPGWTINRPGTSYPIPAGWAAGNYTMTGKVGYHPDPVWDESSFPFIKSGAFNTSAFQPWPVAGAPNPFENIDKGEGIVVEHPGVISTYPNPFNPSTIISYDLQNASFLSLAIYDIRGRKITDLVNGWRDSGLHEVTFDGAHLSSGVYFVRLSTENFVEVKKVLLLK